jgi:hypothetical protein
MRITNKKLNELTGAHSLVKINGTVVREVPTGVAVRFNQNYRIFSLRNPHSWL